jgi:hypothetical protein
MATNQTDWPLGLRINSIVITNAQERVWQLAIATTYTAAKHMLFAFQDYNMTIFI